MPDVNAETAFVENAETVRVAAPTPAQINMPDHPVRSNVVYQLFDRLWRPVTGWVACPVAVLYATVIAPATGRPLSDGYLVQVLMFAGAIYGLKSWEKKAGVA
jgi:hypothetical protein